MTYRTPTGEIAFALEHIAGLDESCDADLMQSLVGEAAKFADGVLSPLHRTADQEGCRLEGGIVKTPQGFEDAYRRYREAGWAGITAPEAYGGQGLPSVMGLATSEIWNAACTAFALAPMLSQSAVDALRLFGSEEQKKHYLPKLVSGEWTGTMNLTEPHAGSDVGAITSKARPMPDGSYKISGTKIFITFGEHQMADNIIHMVLARLPDAPSGTKGISLFLVPKYLKDGAQNDVACVGLEKKMGIHGSPTCVMRYGEKEGAIGFLVGEKHGGMRAMFVMMNAARLQVGMQGVAIAERAFQEARAFAKERKQGQRPDTPEGAAQPIIAHPDVMRMLLSMQSFAEAGRAICYANAAEMDRGNKARADLLVPISKAWGSDMGVEAASLGIQVHGGMGFIEETGAAQLMRDARIAPIYEGTNGIQANDLVLRKVIGDEGAAMRGLLTDMEKTAEECAQSNHAHLPILGRHLKNSAQALDKATESMLKEANKKEGLDNCLAGAVPYLRLAGNSVGGFYLAKGALKAHAMRNNGSDKSFYDKTFLDERIHVAGFFAQSVLPLAPALAEIASAGAAMLQRP